MITDYVGKMLTSNGCVICIGLLLNTYVIVYGAQR